MDSTGVALEDREIVMRLLELGVMAARQGHGAFAVPREDGVLRAVSIATIAAWLEELGKLRLVGDVQPSLSGGYSLVYQVTDDAIRLWDQPGRLQHRLSQFCPQRYRAGMSS